MRVRPTPETVTVHYETAEQRNVGRLSGAVGEELLFGTMIPMPCKPDVERAMASARAMCTSRHPEAREQEAIGRMRLWVAMARGMLAPRRRTLLVLAEALEKAGELSFDQVKAIVENAEEARP